MTTRCVLYARLSVTKEESVSIARQLESGRKYAESRGWEVLGEFTDDGVSATANRPDDRKGWSALLSMGGFDAVVIWKVDRLARRVMDFLRVDEVLRGMGAGLVAVEDPIDMTTAQGRAFATILAVFGEMEAAAISSRIRAARGHMLKAGRWPGGGVPYGYKSAANPDGPGRVLVKDPERNPWLAKALSLFLEGETVNGVTTQLTRLHAPLPSNNRRKTADQSWNRQTVDGLLRNPILAGMKPCNPGRSRNGQRVDPFNVVRDDQGELVVDESLALMTVDEFASLQRLLDSRCVPQTRKTEERRSTNPFLSRVVRCDDCGVYLCRGTNQGKPVLSCPRCRQTIGRTALDPYLAHRLLDERGNRPYAGSTVAQTWNDLARSDDKTRRLILLSQLDCLRVRRGVVGRYFDEDRIILQWRAAS